MFINEYNCGNCGYCWEDEWDCTCDDRCPQCNTVNEPYISYDTQEKDDESVS